MVFSILSGGLVDLCPRASLWRAKFSKIKGKNCVAALAMTNGSSTTSSNPINLVVEVVN